MSKNRFFYRTGLTFLTVGASLILGLLSFGGFYAIYPVVSLALLSFGLSVAYEGEIYWQNIKGALKKLTKSDYQEVELARAFLRKHAKAEIEAEEGAPFLKDYDDLLKAYEWHAHEKANGRAHQTKACKRALKEMERQFATHLFTPPSSTMVIDRRLQAFIARHENTRLQLEQQLSRRKSLLPWSQAFSAISAAFMGLGTSYLLMEAFEVIPFFATLSPALLPAIIAPLSLVAGVAYGLLTFNALQDMIAQDTIRTWYRRIVTDLREAFGVRSVVMALSGIALGALAVALTICTAGTWWTVVQSSSPVFQWMARMPKAVMGVLNPIVTGLSAIVFNLQNTSESLEMVYQAMRHPGDVLAKLNQSLKRSVRAWLVEENMLQRLNPFRLFLTLTVLPSRIALFLGHLISIGVTADRVPGVSQKTSAILGIISEGFEDAHYFTGHEAHAATDDPIQDRLDTRLGEEGHHSHEHDFPTRVLNTVLLPVKGLSALWHYSASHLNSRPEYRLTLSGAWRKLDTSAQPHRPAPPTPATPRAVVLIADLNQQVTKNANARVRFFGEPRGERMGDDLGSCSTPSCQSGF